MNGFYVQLSQSKVKGPLCTSSRTVPNWWVITVCIEGSQRNEVISNKAKAIFDFKGRCIDSIIISILDLQHNLHFKKVDGIKLFWTKPKRRMNIKYY